jgi:transcriptional regulator with AAA-type ATPase domain
VQADGRSTPFVGRLPELALLSARLDEAVHCAGGIVLIAGEPGIGKTRLAEQLSADAQSRGMQVLWGWATARRRAPTTSRRWR